MNAETAGHAGTPQLKQFHMVNINMFRHPKYYKELRSRNKADTIKRRVMPGRPSLDQVISGAEATAEVERAPGPGLKPQASSSKHQASSAKLVKHQATSFKPQATSFKLQAASIKL